MSDSNVWLDHLDRDLKDRLDDFRRGLHQRFDDQSAASNLRLDRLIHDLNEKLDAVRRELRESAPVEC